MKENKKKKLLFLKNDDFKYVNLNTILPSIKDVEKLHKQNNHIRLSVT